MIKDMKAKGICIHNTNNTHSARENYELWKNMNIDPLCHFLVDENEVIQIQEITRTANHTGKGFDNGNLYTIAYEICRSQCDLETYLKAEKRAIKHIDMILKLEDLTTNDIYYHIDFNNHTYCPHRILSLYSNKNEFINTYWRKGELISH